MLYPSESDKPVKAFQWAARGDGTITEATLKTAAELPDAATVKPLSLDDFFAPVVTEQDWFGDEERARAKQFAELRDLLTRQLTNPAAFRVENAHEDQSRVDVYVVGSTEDGEHAGVSTQLIET